ncbi:hypothetical protein Tco_0489465 [Tanacetum coccineum]
MAEQDIPLPTITAMKIPIIKKGECDIWNMRMRQYICHTDNNLWDVIVNGDLEEQPAPLTGESSAPLAPKIAKQLAAKRNQERVKSILLLAIPDEYLLKFHNVADAKSLWEAIKSRFGGNVESKKMQKNIALIMRNKPDIDEIDIDDLYNNLRVYEDELKRFSGSISASQNLAFLSSKNTGSTNEVSNASGDFAVSAASGINQVSTTPCAYDIAYSFLAQPTTSPQLENEDFQQMDGDDLEELDLQWQVAILSATTVTEKGILLENVDLEGVKEEDLLVTMERAIGYQKLDGVHFPCSCWDEKWLVQEGTTLELASPEQMATGKDMSNPLYGYDGLPKIVRLLFFDVATSFDSAVHQVHAVSFDAAVLDVAAMVSAACIIAAGYIVSAGICDAASSFVLVVFIYILSFLLEELEAVPADYVSAGHVLISADRYRIC